MTITPLLPIYRMSVYEPGSEDTIWTPASGAPHSDEFKVATRAGISGFQPYMNLPRGSKGKLNPITKKLQIGSIAVELGDQRTSDGQDLQRWVTAFWGDDNGKMRAIGTKVFIEESLDNGATWSAFFVGQTKSIDLIPLVRYRFTIKEQTRLQKIIEVFSGEPSASVLVENGGYANRQRVMPLGPSNQYGPVAARDKVFGIWRTALSSRNRAIDVRNDSTRNLEPGVRWSSKPFLKSVLWDTKEAWKRESDGAVGPIVRVSQGSKVGRYYLTYAQMGVKLRANYIASEPLTLRSCLLEPIPSDQFEYAPLNHFLTGTGVEFEVLLEQEPSENFPLLISNVHPVLLWRNLLEGKFSTLNPTTGEALLSGSVRIDEGTFDALIADETYKEIRFPIEEPQEMSKFVEEKICQPFELAYRLEPTASAGNAFSKVVPFSTALPTSSAVPEITEEDIVAGSAVRWSPGDSFIVFKSTWYRETLLDLNALAQFEQEAPLEGPSNPTLLRDQAVDWITFDTDNVYGGKTKPFKIDAEGLRGFPFEFSIRPVFPFFFFKIKEVQTYIRDLHDSATFRWSRGAPTVTIEAQRTGSTNDLRIGDWRLLNVDYLPDQFQHQRGGTRLMQCIERTEDGPSLKLSFVDSGRNVQTAAPQVGTFSQIAGTSAASGNVWVTNASVVQGGFAATEQTVASRPDPTASSWDNIYRETFAAAETKSVVLGDIPANSRVWPRFRTWPRTQDDFTIASDWVYPPAPGYFDMAAITAPTNLVASQITAQSVHLSWVPGETSESIELRLKPASSASFETVVYLKEGTNRYNLYRLSDFAAVNPYTASVRHRDGHGGFSADAQVTFTCVGELQTCPEFGRIEVIQDPTSEDEYFPPML